MLLENSQSDNHGYVLITNKLSMKCVDIGGTAGDLAFLFDL